MGPRKTGVEEVRTLHALVDTLPVYVRGIVVVVVVLVFLIVTVTRRREKLPLSLLFPEGRRQVMWKLAGKASKHGTSNTTVTSGSA